MKVEFHPAALREVDAAQAWYKERSLFAASAFLRGLSAAVQRVRSAPDRYPVARPEPVGFSSKAFPSPSTTECTRTRQLWLPSPIRSGGPGIGDHADAGLPAARSPWRLLARMRVCVRRDHLAACRVQLRAFSWCALLHSAFGICWILSDRRTGQAAPPRWSP
jgi:hypothetical protein